MTLDTRVFALDQVNVAELFAEGQRLLSLYDDDRRGSDRQVSYNKEDSWHAGTWTMANKLGQGLPAILDISYRDGAPLRTAEQAASHAEYEHCNHPDNARWFRPEDEVCDKTEHKPACWAEISLDTAYGYKSAGMGCGELHAILVAQLGAWLTAQGVRWRWENEFTSEIHEGPARLGDLISGGAAATDWFRSSALPAIIAQATAAGAELTV